MERRAEDKFHLEISRELGGINEKLNALPKIEAHLALLNGRVGKNEKGLIELKNKMALVVAGLSIFISASVSIIVAIIIKSI